jgi:hypothetical protein
MFLGFFFMGFYAVRHPFPSGFASVVWGKHTPYNEVKGEVLISCYTLPNRSRQSSLEFIIGSVNFIKADHYVVFYDYQLT